ncbi:hypothetical protein RHMOL_Rhmol06G0055900 [Rhododendron molle]|uniref:Uncharacterized protein n=1 Tax=Rhododendron molle TaxID=49168 RepID=A0ACC0N968_RHOML|nr:hypothetical protein RHMOL_Rhmol06G0055900 [Rhododendron molle]
MTSSNEYFYRSFDGFKVLKIPYQSGEPNRFAMYFFLPDERDGLRNLLAKFDSDYGFLNQENFKLRKEKLDEFWIPKFKFSFGFDVSEVMDNMGQSLSFIKNPRDLSEMMHNSEHVPRINTNIIQKAFIEVDEKGTEAAAITCMNFVGCAMPLPKKSYSFVADHPFVLMIKEEKSASGPNNPPSVSAVPLPVPKWCLPLIGTVKINVDGAVCRKKGIVGVGLVARDHKGQILGMASIPSMGLLSPRSVEAMGFREALVFAANSGLSHIIIEGDSLEVVQALIQEGKSLSDCSSILLDCIELLPLFSSSHFTHVNRSCNRVAHSLAKQSLLGARLVSWRGPVPQSLTDLSLCDVGSSDHRPD